MKSISIVLTILLTIGLVFAAPADNKGNGTPTLYGQGEPSGDGEGLQTQEQVKIRVQDGTHMSEDGKQLRIQTQANNRVRLEAGGVAADCDCEMKQEKIQNRTKLSVELSNGKNAEVKIMPDTASERALERLRLNVCVAENSCSIELKEVGKGEQTKLAYELKVERQSKILGMFKKQMRVEAQVNAENGEVIRTNKPWWAFLASEPEEFIEVD